MPGESSAVPTEDRVGLDHLQTSPPTGPQSRQHNPQESVAAVEVQATRRILLENRKLVTKCEDLRLQGRTGSKTGGYQSEKGDEKRAHRGSHHDLTNDRNLFVFRSDAIFGSHSYESHMPSSDCAPNLGHPKPSPRGSTYLPAWSTGW